MSWLRFAVPPLASTLLLACSAPSLDLPSREQTSWTLQLEPATVNEPDVVTANFRGRIVQAPAGAVPWLFRGALSDYYERALRRSEVPAALRERAISLRYWRDGDDCWLQPLTWLEPDATYTLALEGSGTIRTLTARVGSEPRATRLFPPAGSAKHRVVVVCDMLAAVATERLTLEPGGTALRQLPDLDGVPRPGCLTLSADGDEPDSAVSPPLVGGALLDPAPWLSGPSASAAPEPSCAGQLLGGACLEVLDDRLFITPQREDQLWLVDSPTRAVVAATAGARTPLLRGLAPGKELSLHASVLSSVGQLQRVATSITTGRARRHLILNEVFANPLGAEESGEWIELLNDAERPASLAGLWLEDAGGHVALPDVELAPAELVLLVADQFGPSSLDVPVPESARLVKLPSLGTRGLANGGEALLLVGNEGTLSRFPQLSASHAGRSIARRTPDAADDDAMAFAEHGSPGASPGAPNSFDD